MIRLAELHPEGYKLAVGPEGVLIEAGGAAGAFYGAQTLRQLLPAQAFRKAGAAAAMGVPAILIEDQPRFTWRGCLLDVARHFMTKADVLRFIDLMAMHKLKHAAPAPQRRPELASGATPAWPKVGSWRKRRARPAAHPSPLAGHPIYRNLSRRFFV